MCGGIIVGGSVVVHGKFATSGVVCGGVVVCAKKMFVTKIDECWNQC